MLDLTQRNNIIANRVAKILGGLTFLLLVILVTLFGPNVNTPIIFGIGIFFFAIGYSITHGFSKSGKILLCLVPAVLTLMAAILAKLNSSTFTDILYYDARFILILLAHCTLPYFQHNGKIKPVREPLHYYSHFAAI